MPLGYNNDDGAQALDQQQEIDFRRGWQVVDADSGSNLVTAGTGSYDVDVAAGDINTPTGTVTCSAATLDLQPLVDPDLPRIVIVYRDASGVAQTLAGTPAAKQPTGETAPGPIYQPAPDAFSTTDGVVLATVLLEAAASSVGGAQIRDRRMPASLNVDSAEVGSLSTDQGHYNEQLNPDYTDRYPHITRSPELSGPPAFKPHPASENPVLDDSVTVSGSNGTVTGFADPFIGQSSDGTYHMFAEVVYDNSDADICHATSVDGVSGWSSDVEVVISNGVGTTTSYPQWVRVGGQDYLICNPDGQVYEVNDVSNPSPTQVATLFPSISREDATVFQNPSDEKWYIFSYNLSNSGLYVYYSDTFSGLWDGNWSAHPSNPVATGDYGSRPGGRPIVQDSYIDAFFWDDQTGIDNLTNLTCYRITELTTSTFSRTEVATSPVLRASRSGGWNDGLMHHCDVQIPRSGGTPIAAVDGRVTANNWRVGIYTTAPDSHYSFGIREAGGQTLTNNNFDALDLDFIEYDNGIGARTSNGTWVCPKSGYWRLDGRVQLSQNTSGFLFAAKLQDTTNGEQLGAVDREGVSTSERAGRSPHFEGYIEEGTTVELQAYQNSGAGQLTENPGAWLYGDRIV